MYSSSNMLRARKKDASFKPNRVLDKKSSRGMLYENEELRLRTIHINDEVERGHHDIKKLKRENDHLKREIWSLRDGYEKMEQMLRKVITNQESIGPHGESYLPPGIEIDEDGSFILTEVEDGTPPENGNDMQDYQNYHTQDSLNENEIPQFSQGYSRKGSRTTVGSSGTTFYESEDEEINLMRMIDEDSKSLDSGFQLQQSSGHVFQQPFGQDSQDLQFIEAEVQSHEDPDIQNSSGGPYNQQPYHQNLWYHMSSVPPDLEVVTEESEHTNNSTGSPYPRVISPTPTQSSSPNPPVEEDPDERNLNSPANPIIEITPASTTNGSNNSDDPSSSSLITIKEYDQKKEGLNHQVQDLGCFTSIPQKFEASSQLNINNDGKSDIELVVNAEIQSSSSAVHRRKFARKPSFQTNQTLSFPNNKSQQPPFLCFYQSEPSLHSLGSPQEARLDFQDKKKMSLDSATRTFPFSYERNPNYNFFPIGGDKNIVIGYVEENSNSIFQSLEVKEIIDELDTQFESTLESISSVRVMTTSSGLTRIFIILKSAAAVKSLVEKGLTLGVQKVQIRLIDAASACSTLVLSGLPLDSYVNSSIISFLNQYGQVVGPLERRLYKGIDISECQIQIHLVRNLPSILNVNGYEIQAKICQRQDPEINTQPTILTTGTRPPVMHQYSPVLVNESQLPVDSIHKESLDQVFHAHRPVSRTANCQVDFKSQIPGSSSGQSLRLRQASPSPSVQTSASQNTTPCQTPVAQAKGVHTGVRRSVSSNPRLESNGFNSNVAGCQRSPTQQAMGRKMSVCHGILEEDVITHLSNSSPQTGQRSTDGTVINSNAQQQHASKKPVSKLPRLSQGSLIPESQLITANPQQQQPQNTLNNNNNPLYRSMSFDPRRNSNASRHQGFMPEQMSRAASRISVNDVRERYPNQKMYLQNQMSHSSQLGQNGKAKSGPTVKHLTDEQKGLPWCGCWGNGCL